MSINLPLPLLGEMAIFVKVVEAGSFSAAARQLSVSPSAVSRSISRLEQALATRLLQRTTRKLRLSEGGEEVFKRCQEMVNAARSVMEISGQFTHEAEGLVRVSVPKAVGRFVVHPYMPEFLRRYPKVDVQLILEDRQVDLIDDNVDLSIRITDSPPPGLVGRQLLPIEHVLCATPQYLAEHGTPSHPHDLLAHSCIYLGETPGTRAGSFAGRARRSRWACGGGMRRTTPACAWMQCCSMWGLAACRISRRGMRWMRGAWCRCCLSGTLLRPTMAGTAAALADAVSAAEGAGVH